MLYDTAARLRLYVEVLCESMLICFMCEGAMYSYSLLKCFFESVRHCIDVTPACEMSHCFVFIVQSIVLGHS